MFKILYIEDTENNRILITRRLVQSGYSVVTAETAEQGIALARAQTPDLILMDMGLPEIDGWNATRRLKADPDLRHIPVIALTAHVMHGDREKAIACGCDDYDTKPFQFTRLLGKIQSLLAKANTPGLPHEQTGPSAACLVAPSTKDAIAQARHDLCNPLGNILCFCEILRQPDQPARNHEVRLGLNSIDESASRMVKALKQVLDPRQTPGPAEIQSLQGHLRQDASHILLANQRLIEQAVGSQDALLHQDLVRMLDSATRIAQLIDSSFSFYTS